MARRSRETYPEFTCVMCNQPKAPTTYREKPTNFHESVTSQGHVKPGPHCRGCADKVLWQGTLRRREEAAKREQERQEQFAAATRPEGMGDYMWSTMQRLACCPQAQPSPCVCMHAFTCTVHGSIHIGTHD